MTALSINPNKNCTEFKENWRNEKNAVGHFTDCHVN